MTAFVRGFWAVVFGAVALATAGAARRSPDGAVWLLVLLAAVPAVLLLVSACSAARTEASAAAYEWRQRRTHVARCICRCHDKETCR